MSAPELFIIAADLTQMQVNASIDETDVGRMRPGQVVTFRVDAYPTETFRGSVRQVRLNPVTVQNVVTYSTVIDVPNPELKLKPGMTANVVIEIARRTNVMRIPNAALRFRPTKEIFEALHQPMPAELERGFGRGPGGQRNAGGQGTPGTGAPGAPAANAPSGGPQAAARDRSRVPRAQATAGQTPSPRQGSGQAPRQGSGQANAQNSQPRQNRDQGAQQPARDGQPNQSARQDSGQGGGQGRGGFANMTPEERQKRMEERMASMTPEERAQFEERSEQRRPRRRRTRRHFGRAAVRAGELPGGNAPAAATRRRQRAAAAGRNAAAATRNATSQRGPRRSRRRRSATTIDALFAPLPASRRAAARGSTSTSS
jgi:hypothetical protein